MACAVFFDIDNTILDIVSSKIPPSTVTAIQALRANGHYAFLNSGRTRGHIREDDLFAVGFDGMASGLGTLLECVPKKGERPTRGITQPITEADVLYEYRMPAALVRKGIATARQYGFRPMLEGREYVYFEDEDFEDDVYGNIVKARLGNLVQSISEHDGTWEISKFSCDMSAVPIDEGLLAFSKDFDVIRHGEIVCEVAPKGHGKVWGMQEICKHLGIANKDCFAVGDSYNDVEMLKSAGHGIAMGNGANPAKEVAEFVTTEMKDDGIQHALQHFDLI